MKDTKKIHSKMVHSLFNNSICVSISLKRITSHITASLKKSTHTHTKCLSRIHNRAFRISNSSHKDTFPTTIFAIHRVETFIAVLEEENTHTFSNIKCVGEKCWDFNELFEISFFCSLSLSIAFEFCKHCIHTYTISMERG